MRAYAAQPPLPKTARKGSMRPVVSVHRSRWASSAWRQSRAMPATPRTTGQNSDALAEDALEAEHDAEEERTQGDRRTGVAQPRATARPLAGPRRALQAGGTHLEALVGGQEHPQPGVEHQPEAAEEGGRDEEAAHPQHRHAEVGGQAGRDAAGDGRREVAVGPSGPTGSGRVCLAHRGSIVAGARRADHEDRPRADPESPRGRHGRTGLRIRAVPDGGGRRRATQSGAMDNASPTTTEQDPTPPPGGAQPTTGPRVTRDEMKDLGRLRRSVTDRHIAGVAGGIARHLDVDAIIVRVALVVGVFFGGAGLLALHRRLAPRARGGHRRRAARPRPAQPLARPRRGRHPRPPRRGRRLGRRLLVPVAARDRRGDRGAGSCTARSAARSRRTGYGYAEPTTGTRVRTGPPRRRTPRPPRPDRRARPLGAVRPGAAAVAQPAQARTDPVLLHARADRAGRGRPRCRRPRRGRSRRRRLPRPGPRRHRRRCSSSGRSGAGPAA